MSELITAPARGNCSSHDRSPFFDFYLSVHYWIIYLGVLAKRDGWLRVIHRVYRCDLSLFQLGLALLDHLLNEHLPIPVAFEMPALTESVR